MAAFPYMSYKLTNLLLVIGLLLGTLNVLFVGAGLPLVLTSLVTFIGVFLTGWALLSYAVSKQLVKNQRLIAMLFAVIILTGVFGLKILFSFGIFPYNTWI
nr:hypothetical protein [Candidatus Njordarchaeum guaymaensis]